jgi:hypothetical protein
VDYVVQTAFVLNGNCKSCGRAHTILQHSPATGSDLESSGPEGAGRPAEEGPRAERIVDVAPPTGVPTCDVCGSLLSFRAPSGRAIDATCSGCGSTHAYIRAGTEGRGPRRIRATESAPGADASRGYSSSRARPCRECGGPLRFSTNPDGTTSGECGSCGNRFTLPRRRDSDRGPDTRGGLRFGWGSRPKFGGASGPRRYGRPPPGRFRGSDGGPDRTGDDRRRRRPRRD